MTTKIGFMRPLKYNTTEFHTGTTKVYLFSWIEPAEWTTWTSWDACRDDRLPSYGITNTDTRYLTTYQGSSCYNRRTRYCQNQVSTGLKYSRFGGLNQCYYNYISNSDGINDHQDRTCPGLPSSPSKILRYY